jgi:tetratricopeptide (TPR) repeat protein
MLTTADAPPPAPRRRPRRLWLAALAGTLALAVLPWAFQRAARPPPPIPLPAGIGSLDPQVRQHLAGLATQAAAAPRDPERRAELGLAFAVNGLWAEARQSFLHAMELGDRSPLPALYAAVARQETGDLPGAVDELRALVAREPKFMPGWHRLGTLLLQTGDAAAAAEAFQTAARLAPGEWRAWAGLGEALLRAGRAADAVAPLERAVRLDPFARSARHLLGQALPAAGRAGEAALELAAGRGHTTGPVPDAWSRRALGHMRSLPDQFERGDALTAQGRTQEAVRLLQEAHRFHPANRAVTARLARLLQAADRADEARRLLDDARAAAPDDLTLLLAAAEQAAADGRTNESLALARRALAQAPRLAGAHAAEANALVASGDDAAAAAALARAVELAPADVGLRLQLGDLRRFNLHDAPAALADYRAVLELDPIHPVALERLASLHLERGETNAAAPHVARLRRLLPGSGAAAELEAGLHAPP